MEVSDWPLPRSSLDYPKSECSDSLVGIFLCRIYSGSFDLRKSPIQNRKLPNYEVTAGKLLVACILCLWLLAPKFGAPILEDGEKVFADGKADV